ncbi:hypothetical protein CYMTET_11660 [Cymbomonas tetramitiformis]|uniref:Uncharacterized protein n=1 Tax=Cymbomonas tetramitiformis TaxID=36881 RepID=A0AAE0GM38_9CHLO|nr:hypothetical protein CYMTET_11660 [Cymbomonas tetramitiformis]
MVDVKTEVKVAADLEEAGMGTVVECEGGGGLGGGGDGGRGGGGEGGGGLGGGDASSAKYITQKEGDTS